MSNLNDKAKFKIGDKVTMTNDYGVVFSGRTVIGHEIWDGYDDIRYFTTPTDCPWYSTKEINLSFETQS